MSFSISDRLLCREIIDPYRADPLGRRKPGYARVSSKPNSYAKVRGLYGDRTWVNGLDIVNELGGHTGCVNALSWSRSGRLLASGSDDTHLNIHTYQPDDAVRPFKLTTTISTGHSANIFSVKFMPHSNDATLISCAGDDQVRVFDIERGGQPAAPGSIFPSSAWHHSGVNLEELYRGVKYLTPSTTNGRVYRSHADRVKRIITESSPHLFLTCSEDGEVRQWDLRLPSSAYPGPRRGNHVPPPLISYRRFQLDLNTISCSGSQPHYIVLGGTHLHAFLHDRRMIGRDVDAERGSPSHSPVSPADDEIMSKATRCVRRFAPHGKVKMKRNDSGHITACKISDANPNEMIGSWSGDYIYSFDLIASPDATEKVRENAITSNNAAKPAKTSLPAQNANLSSQSGNLSAQNTNISEQNTGLSTQSASLSAQKKKRKRERQSNRPISPSSTEALARSTARARSSSQEPSDVALRVRYGNGQSEDIRLDSYEDFEQTRDTMINESQKRCLRIAASVAKIRKLMFDTDSRQEQEAGRVAQANATGHYAQYDGIISRVASVLPEMEELSSAWTYPMDPSPEMVSLQQSMRGARAASCLFMQACGAVSRLLGGTLRMPDTVEQADMMARFNTVESPAALCTPWQKFCFTFLAAIAAWLEGGDEKLLRRFKPDMQPRYGFSVPEQAGTGSIESDIIPHLLSLANTSDEQDKIVDVDANRFESDDIRILFRTGAAAVQAFAEAVSYFSQSDMLEAQTSSTSKREIADSGEWREVVKFWKGKVIKGILLSAGRDIHFTDVNRAFGGPRVRYSPNEGRNQDEVNIDEPEEVIQQMSLVSAEESRDSQEAGELPPAYEESIAADDLQAALRQHGITVTSYDSDSDDDDGSLGLELDIDDNEEEIDVDEDEPDDDDGEGDDEETRPIDDDDGEDDDEETRLIDDGNEHETEDSDSEEEMNARTLFSTARSYGRIKESVEAHVPCSSHTRVYTGHCNFKTVKDVNFYGLDDEYVVSGSDSGHVFIWDRKTSKLINVLQGDGEVVNVIQGHPFEPMLAVSGIDHTIKIFSPDLRAQHQARHGHDLGTSEHSSHGVSRLRRQRLYHLQTDPLADDADGATAGQQQQRRTSVPQGDPAAADAATAAAAWDDHDDDSFDVEAPTNGGLASCKRMKDSYRIISQNDVDRQGGVEEGILSTRGFLEQLAARIYARRAAAVAAAAGAGGGGRRGAQAGTGAGQAGQGAMAGGAGSGDGADDDGDDEQTIVLGDDCNPM